MMIPGGSDTRRRGKNTQTRSSSAQTLSQMVRRLLRPSSTMESYRISLLDRFCQLVIKSYPMFASGGDQALEFTRSVSLRISLWYDEGSLTEVDDR